MDDDYTTDRALLDYQVVLGTEFTRRLWSLTDGQHWVDAGAGQAFAAREYLSAEQASGKARVTAIGLRLPLDASDCAREAHLRYLAGRPMEEIPLEEIGPADLVTDVYGPLQYSSRPDEVLRRYTHLLAPGGALFIAVPAGMLLSNARGGAVDIRDWLKAIRGLAPRHFAAEESHLRDAAFVRTEDEPFVPPLELLRTISGSPPLREYRVSSLAGS